MSFLDSLKKKVFRDPSESPAAADSTVAVPATATPPSGGAQGASEIVTHEDPAIEISENEGVRELSLPKVYQERPSEQQGRVFQLRYATWGETSNIIAAHGYAWQPGGTQPPVGATNAVGLAVERPSGPAASLTVVFDSELGLAADRRFPEVTERLRSEHGRSLVELTNFTLSKEYKSRRAVAGLFHLLYLYSKQARQSEVLVVQVKQRHMAFYEKMLYLKPLEVRDNVALMGIVFDDMKKAIRTHAGTGTAQRHQDFGLYPFFFPAKDEPGLLFRLLEHLGAHRDR